MGGWRFDVVTLRRVLFVAVVSMPTVGCGDAERAGVSGRVLRHDGTPLVGATVTARSNATGKWATGSTDGQGYYELGTQKTGEGVPAGDYYVIIVEDRGDMGQRPRTIPQKYESASSSGLKLRVQAGETTVLDVKLDPT